MGDLTKEQLAELVAVFREEASRFADELDQKADALREAPGDQRAELIDECLRIAHSLKGAASLVGYSNLERLAHLLEDGFDRLRTSAEDGSTAAVILQRSVGVIHRHLELEDAYEDQEGLLRDIEQLGRGPQSTSVERPSLVPGPTRGEAAEDGGGRQKLEGDLVAQAAVTSSVRVDAALLDRLMGLTGDLLSFQESTVSRKADIERLLVRFHEALQGCDPNARQALSTFAMSLEDFIEGERKQVTRLGNLVSEISSTVKASRMLPLEEASAFWRRVVREVALDEGKSARLTVKVQGIKIDRSIFDGLREPMLHLLRNAVDHGLERPPERQAAGKPPDGLIDIVASLDQGLVRLEVSDDGRGLDVERLRRAADERGRATGSGLEAAHALIFEDGLSTQEEASMLSGRGVGLSVVKRRVEELSGNVSVRSPGRLGGVTFKLSLPVSVLSTKGLLVTAGQGTYAIPSDAVVRTLRIKRTDVVRLDGEPVAKLDDGEPVRLIWLAAALGREVAEVERWITVVLIRAEGAKVALVVSQVIGEQEFVAKRLPWNLHGLRGVTGAVPLANGALAVVVDFPSLIASARGDLGGSQSGGVKARVLVVDDSMTARTVTQSSLLGAGYEVALATNGEEAWQQLREEHFDLVVSDVQMPYLDGFELTKRLRGQAETRHLPVILVSKRSTREDVARGAAAGADEYIVKGKLEQQKLLRAIRRLLKAGDES